MADALSLNATALLAVATLGISLMLVFVSLLSYSRLKSLKLLFAGGAFTVLALKGALGSYRSVILRESDVPGAALDFGVLVFLYASVAKG